MRAMGVLRFVIFGAVGFGLGGTIVGALWPLAPVLGFVASGLLFVLSGALGGASLGLALLDGSKTINRALVGSRGLAIGVSWR